MVNPSGFVSNLTLLILEKCNCVKLLPDEVSRIRLASRELLHQGYVMTDDSFLNHAVRPANASLFEWRGDSAGGNGVSLLGSHRIRYRSQFQSWVHFTVPGWSEGGTTNVHGEVELLVPRHVCGEARNLTQVDGEVAIGNTNSVGSGSGFSPESGTTSVDVVDLELEVVVAVSGNGTGCSLEASLEVQVVSGKCIRGRRHARKEKQG